MERQNNKTKLADILHCYVDLFQQASIMLRIQFL